MLLKDYLNNLKKARNLSWKDISESSGIPEDTVKSIFYGNTADPRISTVTKIVRALGGSLDALEKEHPEIKESLNPLIEIYEKRLRDKEEQITALRNEKHTLVWLLIVLVTVILLLFVTDILVGSRGWILYNK